MAESLECPNMNRNSKAMSFSTKIQVQTIDGSAHASDKDHFEDYLSGDLKERNSLSRKRMPELGIFKNSGFGLRKMLTQNEQ